jgi:hypothetical protein
MHLFLGKKYGLLHGTANVFSRALWNHSNHPLGEPWTIKTKPSLDAAPIYRLGSGNSLVEAYF